MWTPKRLVLLAGGFAVFLSAYFVYALSALGGIDSLPPLPADYWPSTKQMPVAAFAGPRSNKLEARIQQAFGSECQELTRPVKLEMHSKNMVLAADGKVENGGIVLQPMSLAVFGKDKGQGPVPEINTIIADVAYLEFDRPVSNLSEVAGRKLVRAELRGHIHIVNNRRTLDQLDDLCLDISNGPLYYLESEHRIWTDDVIHLTDWASKPKPTEVRGQGMQLDLLTEDAPSRQGASAGAHKNKSDQITGLKKITLFSNVDMQLFVDSRSGFPGGNETPGKTAKDKKPAAAGQPPEKAHVTIKTPGRFEYEIFKDHDMGHFDVPKGGQNAAFPQDVTVTRIHEELGLIDQLVCKHLDLRFRRKEKKDDKSPATDAASEQNLEIETAHATGPEVTLTSDEQKLAAEGNDLFYDAVQSLTILKGEPQMRAVKEGSTIRARELKIQEHKLPAQAGAPARSFQETVALGPVAVDLVGKSTGGQKPIHAACTDNLISTKDGAYDLMILNGQAVFHDDDHSQQLEGDKIKLWLEPEASDATTAKPAAKTDKTEKDKAAAGTPGAAGGHKLHHVEALSVPPDRLNVKAWSPEFNMDDTGRLTIRFKDVPVAMLPDNPADKERVETRKATSTAPEKPSTQTVQTQTIPPSEPGHGATAVSEATRQTQTIPPPEPARGGTAAAGATAATSPAAGPAPAQPTDKQPARPPMHLSARSVEATVDRCGPKNQMEHLWSEGKVRVQQDPAKPDEKGVDVRGETLELTYNPAGNLLVVTGDLAELRLNNIYITGPEVNINQATNTAWVNGIGGMEMESYANLQGAKTETSSPLKVFWNKSMFFNGRSSEFHGGIQAERENSRMAGQTLVVVFDRPISLKEGNKSKPDEQPKVKHLLCDKDVRAEESVIEDGVLKRFQRIDTPLIDVTVLEEDDLPRTKNAEPGNEVHAAGPGSIRIVQRGDDRLSPIATTDGGRPGAERAKPAGSQAGDDRLSPTATTDDGRPGAERAKPAGSPAHPGSTSEQEQQKLTYVQFKDTMYANSKTNIAIFNGVVRVLNIPCDDPNWDFDLDVVLDKLPKGAMYLSGDRLEVSSRGPKGHAQQEMRASGRCVIKAQEYWGRANMVTYDEAKDQLILEGNHNEPARLFKVERQGEEPKEIVARKIIYLRKTGEHKADGIESLDGRQ